jgi:hypothetical protein
MKKLLKLIKSLIVAILLTPLNVVMIPIAIVTLTIKAILRRHSDIEGDLKTMIPVMIRKIKLFWKKVK